MFLFCHTSNKVMFICVLSVKYCYVGQYGLVGYSLKCLGGIILCMIVCNAIHNCSSSGSLFFASLRQNN